MASGFGTFVSSTTVSNGATAAGTLTQSVNTTNRTVTVTLRITAAYRRTAAGSWTPGSGVSIWGSQNSGNYFNGNLDGTTDGLSGVNIGIASVGGMTYTNGNSYTIPAGQVQARSNHYCEKYISKTYSYDAAGSAITGSWSLDMYIPGLSTTHVYASGSFTTDSITPAGDPPTGGYITYNSCTHNSINVTTGVADWGATGGELQAIVVTGSVNGYADPVTSSNWTTVGRKVVQIKNVPTTTLSSTVNISDTSASLSLDSPISIKGMLHYKIAYWNGNTIATLSGLDETQRRLPPAPSQFSYGSPTGSTDLTYQVSFSGNAADNHTTYVRAQLNRTIRYKIGSGNWVYIDNATTAEVDFVTTFSVTVPAGQVATIEGWQTYFGMDSEVSRITLSNTNAPSYLYGSVSGMTKRLGPIYASVNGRTKKLKKIYASAGGVTKKVYEDV